MADAVAAHIGLAADVVRAETPLAVGDIDHGFTQFNNYGIRVPVAVVSPFSKPHYVSKVVEDHTSILKFIETRFGLPSLTARDAAANPMLEYFNFSHPSFTTPPSLPDAPVDPAGLTSQNCLKGSNGGL